LTGGILLLKLSAEACIVCCVMDVRGNVAPVGRLEGYRWWSGPN
jgi:hypothetical protein